MVSNEDGVLYRVHRKGGQPFALIPANRRLQARLAPLLPAQSWKAKLYRTAVEWYGRCELLFPSKEVQVPFPAKAPIVALLRKVSQSQTPPMLLPGNPAGVAPRLVLICLDHHGRPVGVIKAGQTAPARELIRHEHAILQQISNHANSVPVPRPFDLVETAEVSAFGMEFVSGRTPRWPAKESLLEKSLTPWIDESRIISIAESPLWRELRRQGPAALQSFSSFSQTLIHPCLFHGDFAPWNVREGANGDWTAIDWERGEMDGLPGWDWLHFAIQPAILVKRWPAERVLAYAQDTVRTPEFLRYLAKAFPGSIHGGAADCILKSYLLFNRNVLVPPDCPSAYRNVHDALAAWVVESGH